MASRFLPNVAFYDSRHQSSIWGVSSEAVYVGKQVGSKARPIQERKG